MYDDKSAKNLLAQFPQRYAEGGEATPTSYASPSVDVGAIDIPTWASPSVTPRAGGKALPGATSEFTRVQAPPRRLKQFNELPVSPTALSSSQQLARERAAKQAALNAALAQAAAPMDSLERRALLQRLYSGDLTPDALKTQVVDPLFEQRVRNAFNMIGRTGAIVLDEDIKTPVGASSILTALNTMLGRLSPGASLDPVLGTTTPATPVKKSEYDYWADQLKTGKISGAEFESAFLTAASTPPVWSANAAKELEPVNKARALLKLDPLTAKDLQGYVAPPPVYSFNYGIGWNPFARNIFGQPAGVARNIFGQPAGVARNIFGQPTGAVNIANLVNVTRAPAPAPAKPPPAPVDFSRPATTQLFAEGGEVQSREDFIKNNSGYAEGGAVKKSKDPSEGGLTVKDYPNPYGLRAYEKKDGTYGGEMLPKSVGWAGELEGRGALRGSRVTEYSMEDDKGSFPTINPLLSREEIELVASGIVTPTIYKKAVQWRDMQAEKGASAFLNPTGYQKGGDVKKSAEPFGKGEPAKKVEGSPYNKDGAPITVQGPSAMDIAAFINSFIPGTGDVQSAAEGYQAFKDKDYVGAGLGAAGALPFVPNTTKFIRGIPFEGRKSLEKLLRNEDIPFITVPIDKADKYSSNRAYDVKRQLEDLAGAEGRSGVFFHAGDAGIGADTTARNMGGGRDTGHFGTGTYGVTKEEKLPPFYTETRPVTAIVSRPDENLLIGRTEELDKAHRALRKVNALASSDKLLPKDKILRALGDFEYQWSLRETDPDLYNMVELVKDARFDLPGRFSNAPEKMIDAANEHIKARLGAGGSFWKERVQRDSASTRYMRRQGYGGVDTGLAPEMDTTTYGSVIYRKGKY